MIRPMTTKDIAHVQKIAHETWKKTYDPIIPLELQTRFLESAYSDMMLMKRIEKSHMLILEDEGQPFGFANFTWIDEDGDSELTAMCILSTYQRIGYGKKLFESILSELTHAKELSIYVDSKNIIGQQFFEKEGCQLKEVIDEVFEDFPVTTLHYVYTLPKIL